MNAYDRQLQAAIEHLDNINPMFDFGTADRPTQARQLKTWWGRPLADDHLHGHDITGPITAPGDHLTDRQLVLLSALQRGARNVTGPWTLTADPIEGDGLTLTAAGHGLAVSAQLGEGRNGILVRGVDNAAGGRASAWIPELLYQGSYMESPATELADLLALATAFDASPLSGAASTIRRTSYETLEVEDEEVAIDWRAATAGLDEGSQGVLACATGMTGTEAQTALDAVLRTAVEHGHSVPEAPGSAEPSPQPAGHRAGHSSAAADILAGLGINVGNATVIGVPAGGSMSIGIGAGGELSVSDIQMTGPAETLDPEEAFMAACAESIGIPLETFRDIVEGDGKQDDQP